MSKLSQSGISVDVPIGWEASIAGGEITASSAGPTQETVLHLGSFPLPPLRGSFGAGAVESMGPANVMVILFEYGSESANTPLFASQGIPRQLDPKLFDRDALQHGVPGQSGLQHFFTQNGRAFCLYVVLGSHIDRVELVEKVNAVLQTLEIE